MTERGACQKRIEVTGREDEPAWLVDSMLRDASDRIRTMKSQVCGCNADKGVTVADERAYY